MLIHAMTGTLVFLLCVWGFRKIGNYKPPHIVFIVADDLGWNDIGFNNPNMKTPTINKLASEGLILNQAYVQPLCSPSRHSFMTGYYPFHAGLQVTYALPRTHDAVVSWSQGQHLVIEPWQPVCSPLTMKFLPQYLKDLGYATHMVGKWHLGFCNWNCTPTYRGFDSFYGYYNAMEDYYNHSWSGGFDYRDNEKLVLDKNGTYSIFTFEQRAKNLIQQHDVNIPLFLYLPFQNVHEPVEVPKKYEDKYPNIKNDGRRRFSGMVTVLDEAIGNITAALQAKGILDDTLIVFTADNGGWTSYYGNNYPLRGGKFTIYEGGTRAAAFIKGPGLTVTGQRYNGLMHAVDWLPTLVSAAGGKDSNVGDGVSQWEAIRTFTASARNEIVYNIDDHFPPEEGHAAIRIGNYKLIDGYPGLYDGWYKPQEVNDDVTPRKTTYEDFTKEGLRYKLFDLSNDPNEHTDLSKLHPELVTQLSRRLKEYHKTMVPANYPADKDPKSNPKNYNGAWSPGWC